MKNLLSENMMRFGTKNLSESQKRDLTLESIMQTIEEYGLHGEVKAKLLEQVLDLTQNIKDLNLLFVKNMGSMQKNGTKYEGRYYFKAYESKIKPGVTVFTLNEVTKTGQQASIWGTNTDAIIRNRLTKDYIWSTLTKALSDTRQGITTTDGKPGMISAFPSSLKQKVDEILTKMGAA